MPEKYSIVLKFLYLRNRSVGDICGVVVRSQVVCSVTTYRCTIYVTINKTKHVTESDELRNPSIDFLLPSDTTMCRIPA